MFKIVKVELWSNLYHYEIIDENKNKLVYSTRKPCETLRELIISFIELYNDFEVRPFNKNKYKFKYEIIDTLESLDLDYIKNKFIHYLI